MGGMYTTSQKAEEAVVHARQAMSDFLGCEPVKVVFGASMTALTYHLSHSLGRERLKVGDNIVLDLKFPM